MKLKSSLRAASDSFLSVDSAQPRIDIVANDKWACDRQFYSDCVLTGSWPNEGCRALSLQLADDQAVTRNSPVFASTD